MNYNIPIRSQVRQEPARLAIVMSLFFVCLGTSFAQQHEEEEPQSPAAIRLQQAEANPPDFLKDDPAPLHWDSSNDALGGVSYHLARVDALLGNPFGIALLRGRWLVRQGKYSQACTEFETAAKIRPDYFPYEEWAEALESAGNSKAANEIYKNALEQKVNNGNQPPTMSSRSPAFWMQYALFLVRQKNYAEALTAYEKGRQRGFPEQGTGEAFRLTMTSDRFDKTAFDAAAHTILGKYLCTFRNRADYAYPNDARIREYKVALALRPNFLPAILYLAEAYKYHYNAEWKAMVPELLARAAQSRFPDIKTRAREIQDDLAK